MIIHSKIKNYQVHLEEDFSFLKNIEKIELVKKSTDVETTTIISMSPSTIQILDPVDYSAVDLEMKEEFSNYNIGDEIKLIQIDNYTYLLN